MSLYHLPLSLEKVKRRCLLKPSSGRKSGLLLYAEKIEADHLLPPFYLVIIQFLLEFCRGSSAIGIIFASMRIWLYFLHMMTSLKDVISAPNLNFPFDDSNIVSLLEISNDMSRLFVLRVLYEYRFYHIPNFFIAEF